MSYKTILVHIDSGSHCATRVEVAIRLARQHDSHLVALDAIAPFEPPGYVMAEIAGTGFERAAAMPALVRSLGADDVVRVLEEYVGRGAEGARVILRAGSAGRPGR